MLKQRNYEIQHLLFAETDTAGLFSECLPQEDCRMYATRLILASDGNQPNFQQSIGLGELVRGEVSKHTTRRGTETKKTTHRALRVSSSLPPSPVPRCASILR